MSNEQLTANNEENDVPQGLQAELDEWRDRALRTQADFENFRKRSTKERESLIADVRAATVAALLPVYDNLLRASQQPTEDTAYAKGVELTLQQLLSVLSDLGVEPFGYAGERFDPNIHDAVASTEDKNAEPNSIIEVFAQGFRLNDKILRHAVVRVAN